MMFSSYYLFLFAFLSLTFLHTESSNVQPPDLIRSLCSETKNSTFCLDFLGHLYHSGENLRDLAQDLIQTSTNFLHFTYDDIHVREIETSNNPALNMKYHRCGVQYTAAVNALIQSTNFLQSGNYQKVFSLASLAFEQPSNCDSNFNPPESEPADFKSINEKALDVCSIVLAVSKRLASGKA
ncbi:hypothetical protein BUALT_Bualt14G0131500 [Buddleja alternifolia]|uniref:Pectinesterase inhibitor domain-containing protein n=1 Tax=Buddleja alternifolia TaxID=168488 RepID=A0AAV6WR76_9LAMI|nr:hypothetical protein BUALT_Bualt14G0131500 [Buddleja alternifolia]